jgi:hypothetical protein
LFPQAERTKLMEAAAQLQSKLSEEQARLRLVDDELKEAKAKETELQGAVRDASRTNEVGCLEK